MTNKRKWKKFKRSQRVRNYDHGYLYRLLDKAFFWDIIREWEFLKPW